MKEKTLNCAISVGCDWKFFLIPTIELDWDTLEGTTSFRFLWFYLKFKHVNSTYNNNAN